jgi:hypothetical protein
MVSRTALGWWEPSALGDNPLRSRTVSAEPMADCRELRLLDISSDHFILSPGESLALGLALPSNDDRPAKQVTLPA